MPGPRAPDPATAIAADELPAISVVIPVHNGAATLDECLQAVMGSRGVSWECVVVDDASTDASAMVARSRGARVVRLEGQPAGPAYARNVGARLAEAPLVCFIDADVLIRPDTLALFAALFQAEAGLTAAFGSYDAEPREASTLSQYRNLLHHFVHQSGHEAASTFWAGCGAMRRTAFLSLGGFDVRYARPSIEDIELGYRIHAAGGKLRLQKDIQVTHLKRWSFWDILRTDVRDRAIPWARLIARTRFFPNDLNLQTTGRASGLAVWVLALLVLLGWWEPVLWLLCLPVVGLLLYWNRSFYAFLLKRRGLVFALKAIPLHWLYYGYSSLAFVGGIIAASLSLPWRVSSSVSTNWTLSSGPETPPASSEPSGPAGSAAQSRSLP